LSDPRRPRNQMAERHVLTQNIHSLILRLPALAANL
jgi:hypothetical protein